MTPEQLIQARKDAGLLQSQMADQMNVGLPTYKTWEGLATRGNEFGPRMKLNVELRFERWKNRKVKGAKS